MKEQKFIVVNRIGISAGKAVLLFFLVSCSIVVSLLFASRTDAIQSCPYPCALIRIYPGYVVSPPDFTGASTCNNSTYGCLFFYPLSTPGETVAVTATVTLDPYQTMGLGWWGFPEAACGTNLSCTVIITVPNIYFQYVALLSPLIHTRIVLGLSSVSGNGQEGPVNSLLPQPLIVKMTDQYNNPVPRGSIYWVITGSDGQPGGSVDFRFTDTIADGSSRNNVTLGSLPGLYTITATCFSCDTGSPQTFTATATPKGCTGLNVQVYDSPWPQSTGGVPSTTVTANVSEPAPPGGCVVDFETPVPIVGSGGHQHGGDRPHGSLYLDNCTIGEGLTFCVNIYSPSEVAGEENIVATLRDTGETAIGTVQILVPGLEPLTASAIGSWRLTGQTGMHNSNHYGTASTNTRIRTMATDYFEEAGIAIGINDISLVWGGLFDWQGTWAPPHSLHRIGKSLDVDHLGVDEKLLNKFAGKYGCQRYEVSLIHYECP